MAKRTPNSPLPVSVKDLSKRFGGFTAVDAVRFEVQPGEVMGYLGPNGSGKTTTIRMLLGLLRPTEGSAKILGFDIVESPEEIRQQVGYMSQKFALYDDLSVWENVAFYAGVYGIQDNQHLENTLARVSAMGIKDELVADLPVGWRQRLSLAVAIVHSPRLVFLDEPTSGIDPNARREFWNLIYELVDEGITAFVTTHFMDEAEYCHRVGIMRAGKLMALDSPENLRLDWFQDKAWDIHLADVLGGLAALEGMPGVLRVGLAAEHLRAITEKSIGDEQLAAALQKAGISNATVERIEPSLEDVFLSLARE